MAGNALIPFSCIASIASAAETAVPLDVSFAPIVPPVCPDAGCCAADVDADWGAALHATPAATAKSPLSRRKRRRDVAFARSSLVNASDMSVSRCEGDG